MCSFSDILVWIALAGSTASVAFGAVAFAKRRDLASAFLLDGALRIWTPLASQMLVSFDSGATTWLTLAGIAFVAAYMFYRPWREVPAEDGRLFNTSLVGFAVIFPALFILRVVLFSAMTPDRNIPRIVSVLLDMAQTFFAVTMMLLATVACIWLHSDNREAEEGESD
jgi:hypothetical protein